MPGEKLRLHIQCLFNKVKLDEYFKGLTKAKNKVSLQIQYSAIYRLQ